MKKQNKKKILIVGPINKKNLEINGGTLTSLKLLKNSEISNKYKLNFLDTCQKSVPAPNLLFRLHDYIFRFFKYLLICFFNKPDFILFFFGTHISFTEKAMMNLVGKLFGIKTIMFPRANIFIKWCKNNIFNLFFVKKIMVKVDKVVCQGEEMRSFFVEDVELHSNRVCIVKNWTLTPDIQKLGMKKLNQLSIHNKKFLFIGWLIKEKGIFELIDAFIEFKRKYRSAELFIAGNGKEYNSLKKIIQNNKYLYDSCKLLGWVGNEKKIWLLEQCDTFILPSYSEGFPNVLVEALGAGLSVISTEVGAIKSQLNSKEEFIPIRVMDAKNLCSVMQDLVENPILHKKMISSGFKKASNSFSLVNATNELIKILENINA